METKYFFYLSSGIQAEALTQTLSSSSSMVQTSPQPSENNMALFAIPS
jgi:hypothetical protein